MDQELNVFIGPSSVISALGDDLSLTFDALKSGISGLKPQSLSIGADSHSFFAQLIDDSALHVTRSDGSTRLEALCVAAARKVLSQADVSAADSNFGLVLSTTKGNISLADGSLPADDSSPLFLSSMARSIARQLGVSSQPVVVSNACISGVAATLVAARLVAARVWSHALVIAADELSPFISSGFLGFRSVSPQPCRPYDMERDGLSLGEAVACVLLSADKSLSRGFAISGGSLSDDANHISGPSRTGEPLAHAISQAMTQAHIASSDVAFVNTHGTATVYNDEMESKALALCGLSSTPLNSLKPYFGHTLGAAGLLEALVGTAELAHGAILPTLGFKSLGTPCPVNISAHALPVSGHHFIKTVSGFGGCNAAIVVSDDQHAQPLLSTSHSIWSLARHVSLSPGSALVDDAPLTDVSSSSFPDFIRQAYHAHCQPNMKFFKMDDLSKLGYVGAELLLQGLPDADPYDTAILLANHASSLDTDLAYCRMMNAGEANPAKFVYTLPNIVVGEICIRHHIKGESLFIILDGKPSQDALLQHAATMLDLSNASRLICGWCEFLDGRFNLDFFLFFKS